jgi:hypothetical protein
MVRIESAGADGGTGSFEVRADDGALADVPGARLRALLMALALEPGRVVSKAIDAVENELVLIRLPQP